MQLPTLAIIGAGTIKPYFPNISIIWLVVIALSIFLTIGFIDRYAKFLHEEANYGTEMTPLLMKGLRGELKDK